MNANSEPEPTARTLPDNKSIALCLSGGGLRATLFHLGLIRALRKSEINGIKAIEAVREVYAVSGGSILAAHFLTHYAEYLGDEEQFKRVEEELLAFAGRDLRNRVMRRWPLLAFSENARGQLLQNEYDRLLGKRTIGECYPKSVSLPTFHFVATSFTDGMLCSFSRTCFEQIDRGHTTSTPADGIPLAFAVAASSAFPPMFPPIALTPAHLGTGGSPPFNSTISLSDGGVFDNFGVEKFCGAQREGARPGLLIVSNAGGSFGTDPAHTYRGLLSRNIRASDILMRRVGETTLKDGAEVVRDGLVVVSIGNTRRHAGIAETTQLRFRLVRTDLDRFDAKLATLLVDHGERIGLSALAAHQFSKGEHPTFSIRDAESERNKAHRTARQTAELDRKLSRAARSSWAPLFFDFRDFIPLAFWWIAFAAVVTVLGWLVRDWSVYNREMAQKGARADVLQSTIEVVRAATANGDMSAIRKAVAIAVAVSETAAKSDRVPVIPPDITTKQVDAVIKTPPVKDLPVVKFNQKVYVQFAGALTRAQITALNEALAGAGWNMQGTSGKRTAEADGLAEVRYADGNQQAADRLADALNSSGLPIRHVSARYNFLVGNDLQAWISR